MAPLTVEPRLTRSAIITVCIAFGAFGALCVLAGRVVWTGFWPFDCAVLQQLHVWSHPSLDKLFLFLSAVGYRYGVFPGGIVLIVILALRHYGREGGFALTALAGSAIANTVCKYIIHRPRPDLWVSIAPEASFSFPSGHSMASMAFMATCVMLTWHTRWRRRALVIGVPFVIGVGVSRMYLGVHYPSDVLAGWCMGLIWASGAYALFFARQAPWQTT